jgi:hypothetical protein
MWTHYPPIRGSIVAATRTLAGAFRYRPRAARVLDSTPFLSATSDDQARAAMLRRT